MRNKSFFVFASVLLIGFIFLGGVSSYQLSSPSYTNYNSQGFLSSTSQDLDFQCESEGQDFVLQLSPFSCTPAVVRSDLLEEQDVPVFCQIVGTKINPLVNVEAINTITLEGEGVEGIKDFAYHPSRSALGVDYETLSRPALNNLGYAVFILDKIESEADLMNCEESSFGGEVCWYEGEVTAHLNYDLKDAFGVGQQTFYLPVFTENDWEIYKNTYSFWKGKGYIRATVVDEDSAEIRIFDDTQTIANFDLDKGETSQRSYLPGYTCTASFNAELVDTVAPDTFAKMSINGNTYTVLEGEEFLDGRCKLTSLDKRGLVDLVGGYCKEETGREKFFFSVSPRVELEICEGTSCNSEDYGIGDYLYSNEEKYYYVGFLGRYSVFGEEINYVRIVESPEYYEDGELPESILSDVSRYDSYFFVESGGSLSRKAGIAIVKQYAALFESGVDAIKDGEYYNFVRMGETEEIGEHILKVVGFSSPENKELNNEILDSYDKAVRDYNNVIDNYASYYYPDEAEISEGEEAFLGKIILADSLGQKEDLMNYCSEFKEKYSDSDYLGEADKYCGLLSRVSSLEQSSKNVYLDDGVKSLTFNGIYEPSEDEYSVELIIRGVEDGCAGIQILQKDEEACLSDVDKIRLDEISFGSRLITDTESIYDAGYEEPYAVLDLDGIRQEVLNEVFWKDTEIMLVEGQTVYLGKDNKYALSLRKINLKRMAKVKIKPSVSYSDSEATFPFKIGVEKRGSLLGLNPAKVTEKIDSLTGSIETWEGRLDKLGTLVKTMKYACVGTYGVLTLKNFLFNIDGKSIARQKVMRDEGGWYDICNNKVRDGEYSNVDRCLIENNDLIEANVTQAYSVLQERDEFVKDLQENHVLSNGIPGFSDKVIDTDALADDYLGAVKDDGLLSKLQGTFGTSETVKINGEDVNLEEFVMDLDSEMISLSDLRDLDYYSRLESESARKELSNLVGDLSKDQEGQKFVASIKSEFDGNPKFSDAGINFITNPTSQKIEYGGAKLTKDGLVGDGLEYFESAKEYPYHILCKDSLNCYLVILDSSDFVNYHPVKVFGYEGMVESRMEVSVSGNAQILGNYRFVLSDPSSYAHVYESSLGDSVPTVRFFETEPYSGLPAIVPFDLEEGWYVSIKQTVGVGNQVRSYDDSAKLNSFYLCNVGTNNKEENRGGDDDCRSFLNGQTYDSFSTLGSSTTKSLVQDAIKAVESASVNEEQRSSGKIRYRGRGGKYIEVKVGPPSADVPDLKCQDFMSAKDCQILFNVCDPVICPSSRCDLGGSYPVTDVVQSGVVGSVALCLPNFVGFGGDVYVPVCLSGLHAGLDGWIQIKKDYKKCLEEAQTSGKQIGICDEISSIYQCEFFYRQGLPLAKLLVPKAIEYATGQGTRGGGEYLGLQSAISNVDNSVDYFTQYYAENSFAAFRARSTQEIGTEICKGFVSGVFPIDGASLDIFTDPDSPPQFTGRFEEIPYTTVTNPAQSQYKVFYHIYAGRNQGVYYQIYLKGDPSSSFYKDSGLYRVVEQGYINAGETATATEDFLAPSGYSELCINVNGQEECGFQEVSTSFSTDYLSDLYVASQANQTGIQGDSECISGSQTLYSAINPNLAEGLGDVINPEIYNLGITRVCATSNPGEGTNPSRWTAVGECSDEGYICWLDGESVKSAIDNLDLSDQVLSDQEKQTAEYFRESGEYILDDTNYDGAVSTVLDETDEGAKVEGFTYLLERVFFQRHIGNTLIRRAQTYGSIAFELFKDLGGREKSEDDVSINSLERESMKKYLRENGISFNEDISDEDLKILYESNYIYDYFGEYPVIQLRIEGEKLYYVYSENGGQEGVWFWSHEEDGNLYPVEKYSGSSGATLQEQLIVTPTKPILDAHKEVVDTLYGNKYNVNFEEGVKILTDFVLEDENNKIESEKIEVNGDRELSYDILGGTFTFEYNGGWEVYYTDAPGPVHEIKERFFNDFLKDKTFDEGIANVFKNEVGIVSNVFKSSSIEQKYGEEIYDLIKDKKECSDCDGGWFDSCREDECLAIGELRNKNCDWEDKSFFSGGTCYEKGTTNTLSCSSVPGCRNAVAREVYRIAKEVGEERNVDDLIVERSGVAKSFACLVSQVALQESTFRQCNNILDSGDALYCEGDKAEVYAPNGEDFGVMQINAKVHSGVKSEIFEENVRYGINLLIDGYSENERYYICKDKDYSGWEYALRGYNGWNTDCSKGDKDYVENVISRKYDIGGILSECK